MNLSQLGSGETLAVLLVGMSLLAGILIAVTCGLAGIFAGALQHKTDAKLKYAMVTQGMSADDILRVIADPHHHQGHRGGSGLPLACEAVVANNVGDWSPALVLQAADGVYLVHYVGEDMSQNEWVGPDRIRFPVGSPHTSAASPWNSSYRNGVPVKGPMEQEV